MRHLSALMLASLVACSVGCQSCTSGSCGAGGLWGAISGGAGCDDGSCVAGANGAAVMEGDCADGSCGLGGGGGILGDKLRGGHGRLAAAAGQACNGTNCGMTYGPTMGAVTYPYYTTRGPRDFFLDDPPSIGR
jgi:hypothetical protein